MKELLDKIKLFVLDMDGTFYLGENQIDGALEFTCRVRETGRDFVFLQIIRQKTESCMWKN